MVFLFIIPATRLRGFENVSLYFSLNADFFIINSPRIVIFFVVGNLKYGIKCVISPSFADIFYSNCFKNGILPIVLDEKNIQELAEYSKREENIEIRIQTQEILFGNKNFKFDLDPFKKKCLMEGLDDIELSLEKLASIQDYEKKLKI